MKRKLRKAVVCVRQFCPVQRFVVALGMCITYLVFKGEIKQ